MEPQQQLHDILQQVRGLKLMVGKDALIVALEKNLRQLVPSSLPESAEEVAPNSPREVSNQENILEKLGQLQLDIIQLKEIIIKVNPSISYEKITDFNVKRQLIADNIRMESSLTDLTFFEDFHEQQAFRRFCTFAAFQIEELLNYHYHNLYQDDMSRLKAHFHQFGVSMSGYNGTDNIDSINKVKLASKLQAYNWRFYGGKNSLLTTVVSVRNMEEHRCTVLLSKRAEPEFYEKPALKLIDERRPTNVREYLKVLYNNVAS